jgi:2-dehydro-3-deoxygluconokinase
MIRFAQQTAAAIGEAMIEMAPVGEGLYRRGFAGDTFNTAWHMAQILPPSRVRYVTRVGQDGLSGTFIREIAADGVDVTGISRDPVRIMGLYLIELDGVERSFHYWRKDAAARLLAEDRATLDAALQGLGLIHVSGITLGILAPEARQTLFGALAAARNTGTVVSFDPNFRPRLWSSLEEVRAVALQMLALTDIALPSFDDEAMVWGDATPAATWARMRTAGVAEVVVKNGAGAVSFGNAGGSQTLATPQVADVRDTTGAGDGFNAGYLAARLMGKGPTDAVVAAQRLSAEVICHFGARIPKDIARRATFKA